MFKCITLRSFPPPKQFPSLVSLLNCVRRQTYDKEVSNIVYVEVVSEKADSKPTLVGVIARLHKLFLIDHGQKHVFLVGDAKTYVILKEICYEYASQLQWLTPYPGDWHILLNYQKALMKPYADAGLASLGKVSGHKGETLASLIHATNFRRTHEFLLQAYEAIYRYFLSLYN